MEKFSGKKFEVKENGAVYVRGVDAATYVRLGVLPVNTPENRAEILHRLRNANPDAKLAARRGAGRAQAREIFSGYCAEIEAAK